MGGEGEREGKEAIRKRKAEGRGKGKEGESVPLALILQFDHWLQRSPRSGRVSTDTSKHVD